MRRAPVCFGVPCRKLREVLWTVTCSFFFFKDPATPEISPLSLPGPLPISQYPQPLGAPRRSRGAPRYRRRLARLARLQVHAGEDRAALGNLVEALERQVEDLARGDEIGRAHV